MAQHLCKCTVCGWEFEVEAPVKPVAYGPAEIMCPPHDIAESAGVPCVGSGKPLAIGVF